MDATIISQNQALVSVLLSHLPETCRLMEDVHILKHSRDILKRLQWLYIRQKISKKSALTHGWTRVNIHPVQNCWASLLVWGLISDLNYGGCLCQFMRVFYFCFALRTFNAGEQTDGVNLLWLALYSRSPISGYGAQMWVVLYLDVCC